MEDNPTPANDTQVPADDSQQDDQGLLDKVKDAIPGGVDDTVIDAAAGVADKVGDVTSAAGEKIGDVADTVTDKIPGELDDKLVDGAKNLIDKAGDVVDKVTGGGDDAPTES